MEAIQNYSVFIDPIFGTSDDVNKDTQMKRVEFEMKFSLKCTADFVHVPDYFLLMHNGRSFKFDVDPTKLPAGVHTASIYGYDTTKPELGPRFHIPITIAKTLEVDDTSVDFGELEVCFGLFCQWILPLLLSNDSCLYSFHQTKLNVTSSMCQKMQHGWI